MSSLRSGSCDQVHYYVCDVARSAPGSLHSMTPVRYVYSRGGN